MHYPESPPSSILDGKRTVQNIHVRKCKSNILVRKTGQKFAFRLLFRVISAIKFFRYPISLSNAATFDFSSLFLFCSSLSSWKTHFDSIFFFNLYLVAAVLFCSFFLTFLSANVDSLFIVVVVLISVVDVVPALALAFFAVFLAVTRSSSTGFRA